MFRVFWIVFLSVSILAPIWTRAEENESLSGGLVALLQRNLNEYYQGPAEGNLDSLRNIRAWWPVQTFLLAGAKTRLEGNPKDPATIALSGALLDLVAQKVARMERSAVGRLAIEIQVRPILREFSRWDPILVPVMRIYDHLGLWSAEDFGFLMGRLEFAGDLEENSHRLDVMIPSLSARQKSQLAEFLRRPGTDHRLTALLLLYRTELATGQEITDFLRLASDVFAERLASKPPGVSTDDETVFQMRVLEDLMRAMRLPDPQVKEAFVRAVGGAEWSARRESQGGKAARMATYRLLFFEQFGTGSLNWIDSAEWRGGPAPVPAKMPAPEAKGLLLQGDFGKRLPRAQAADSLTDEGPCAEILNFPMRKPSPSS